jgi:hypothetical protein
LILFVFFSDRNLSERKDTFIVEEASLRRELYVIVYWFRLRCWVFLFVASCCLYGLNLDSCIWTGTTRHEFLSVGILPGVVVALEVDLNEGMINFAIGGKLVGKITGISKGVYFGVCLSL